jgi:MoxR-like ATPase
MQRMKIGDQILIHLIKNKSAGICKVVREYFEDSSKMWDSNDIYRHRIGIEPLKLPPFPVDAKYSYDKYLRTEHGAARGYFGNAIREIPENEFSIFEKDIDRSINEQNTTLRVQVNEKIGKSNIYLTAYDDTNLKISKKTEMLGWKDRPSKLSVGDYVFVYNSETDTIETCFEIKSLSTIQDPIWHEETDSPSSGRVYVHRWNAIVKADGLGINNDIIFDFEPFKSDKKNFSMLIKNEHPRSLTGIQYDEFRNFLLDTIRVPEEQYLLLLTQPDTRWEDKEGSEYHYGNNVPNYTKITPNSKVIFCVYNNSKTIFLGHAQVESIIQENRGRTTPSGRPIIENIAKIKDYEKFSPPKIINSRIQESIRILPNYNNQHSIVQITKDIYNLIISEADLRNGWSFDIEKAIDEILLPDTERELAVDRQLVKRIFIHLKAGKHVILVGSPGTGKTDLARRILEIIGKKVIGNDSFLESVASDEWGRYEVIGGNNLKNEFQEGWVTKAANDNKWLLIDEFNRANMNKAFGELFLAIEYHKIKLRPTESNRDKDTIEIPQNFRMICTMNDFDKNLLLTELSYGLINRFAFVPITPDVQREPIVVERRVKSLLRNDATYEKCREQIKSYFEFINYVRKERSIGVRTSIDIVKYLISATEDGNDDDNHKWLSLNNALCDYVLPQFDRLDSKIIDAVLKYVESNLTGEAFKPLKDELQKTSGRLQKASGWLNR